MIKYNKAMEELEKKKQTDGYLSEPAAQLLQFKSEPNASMRFVSGGKVYSQYEWQSFYNSNIRRRLGTDETQGTNDFSYINRSANSNEVRTVLFKGEPLKVEYTNLKNSYFNGKKISKVEYTYTLKYTGIYGVDYMPVLIQKDPTVTIWYINFYGESSINLKANFYDEKGQKIDMTGALLSFSSLNNGKGTIYNAPSAVGKLMVEKVLSFNGEYIYISGSSIKVQRDGGAYSSTDNEHKANGSRFSVSEWDDTKSEGGKPTWYGAIVGKAKSANVELNIGASKRGVVWFALNSDIRAIGVPNKPVEPVKPTPPEEPQCPNIQANYHYDILYYQPAVEKKVTDDNNSDINNNTVLKDSVVKFILSVADLPAGHEKIDSLVFTDKLPEGYKLDLAGTKQASPNYDVAYDKDANEIKFSAKSDYLNTINADLNAEVNISAPVITGTVTKEGTTYKNDFKLTINNEYSVKSKPVKVHTPTEPKKEVFKGGTTTKIDGKVVQPEEELTYEITYKNTTGKDVNATITDKIPEHTTFVSAENGGTESGGTVKWNVTVAKDQSVTVKFTVKVDKNVNGAPIDNVAKVNDGTNEYKTNETHNPTGTEPKKEVFKGGTTTKIDGKVVQPEEELTYEITYKNTTGKDVNATITDKIPAHTTFVSAENGGTESGGTVKWNVAVPKDKSATVKFTVKVDKDVNGAPIDNVAKVNDGTNEYKTNETHNPTPTEPKKEVFKGGTTTKIDGKRVEPEQELTYAITYKNTTGKDVNATITDKIPAHTKFVSAENGGTESGGTVKWNVAVAKDKSVTVKFTVKVDKDVNGAPIDNVAKVNDGTNEYKTNETHNPTPTEPKKEVFKGGTTTNIDGKPVKGGEELTYEITYKNTTGEDVNATITDKIPAHTKFVSAENGGTESGGTVKWNVAVAKDQSVKVKFTVKVDKDVNGAPIDNVAKVNDGVNEYKTNETHNPTPTEPKKEVFKYGTTTNIDGKTVEPGQKLTYSITYKNTTGSERDVTITDNIPTYTTFVSADNDGVFADGKVTWTKKVAAGKTYKVTFTVQVNKDAYEVMVINKATVRDGFNDSDTNVVKNPTPKKTVPGTRKPKTGDDNNIIPFAILLLASLGGLGGTVTIRRKRH